MVKEASRGHLDVPWPAQLNRLVWEGEHDLVLSIGQVHVVLVGRRRPLPPQFSGVTGDTILHRLRKPGVGGLGGCMVGIDR